MSLLQSYMSQWAKLRRPMVLAGTLGSSMFFAALTTVLLITHTGGHGGGDHHDVSKALLAQPSGVVYGLTAAAGILGVIAIVCCAHSFASEYSQGTLRNLLVRQPRRAVLLAGSYLALVTLLIAAAAFATISGALAAFIVAPGSGITTESWNFGSVLSGFADVTVAMVGYGTFGAALALLLRSPVAAVGVGVAWFLPIEAILNAAVSGADKWLPGQLLSSIAQHTTPSLTPGPSLGHALLLSAIYLAGVAAAAVLSFKRRDVSA